MVEPVGNPAGSQESGQTVAIGQDERMINFKSLTVSQLNGEGMKGTPFREGDDECLKILNSHDRLSMSLICWRTTTM